MQDCLLGGARVKVAFTLDTAMPWKTGPFASLGGGGVGEGLDEEVMRAHSPPSHEGGQGEISILTVYKIFILEF